MGERERGRRKGGREEKWREGGGEREGGFGEIFLTQENTHGDKDFRLASLHKITSVIQTK